MDVQVGHVKYWGKGAHMNQCPLNFVAAVPFVHHLGNLRHLFRSLGELNNELE